MTAASEATNLATQSGAVWGPPGARQCCGPVFPHGRVREGRTEPVLSCTTSGPFSPVRCGNGALWFSTGNTHVDEVTMLFTGLAFWVAVSEKNMCGLDWTGLDWTGLDCYGKACFKRSWGSDVCFNTSELTWMPVLPRSGSNLSGHLKTAVYLNIPSVMWSSWPACVSPLLSPALTWRSFLTSAWSRLAANNWPR